MDHKPQCGLNLLPEGIKLWGAPMLTRNLFIRGINLEDPSTTFVGSKHFLDNYISEWYTLSEIDIRPGGAATLKFDPCESMKVYHPEGYCSLSFWAREDFLLINKEQCDTQGKSTITYWFLDCRKNEAGESYFHYDILQKQFSGRIAIEDIQPGISVEQLIREGFKNIKSDDDCTRSSNSVIYEGHRKAS